MPSRLFYNGMGPYATTASHIPLDKRKKKAYAPYYIQAKAMTGKSIGSVLSESRRLVRDGRNTALGITPEQTAET